MMVPLSRLLLFVLSLVLNFPVFAQITVQSDDDSVIYDFSGSDGQQLIGNEFQSYLEAEGFSTLVADADVLIDSAGSVTFSAFAGASDFSTQVIVGKGKGRRWVKNRRIGYFSPSDPAGLTPFNRILEFDGATQLGWNHIRLGQRKNQGSGPKLFFGLEAENVGVFVPDVDSTSGLTSVIFAFNDLSGDFDFDDLLIRADFVSNSPAPVPAPGMLLVFALVLTGIILRRRTP